MAFTTSTSCPRLLFLASYKLLLSNPCTNITHFYINTWIAASWQLCNTTSYLFAPKRRNPFNIFIYFFWYLAVLSRSAPRFGGIPGLSSPLSRDCQALWCLTRKDLTLVATMGFSKKTFNKILKIHTHFWWRCAWWHSASKNPRSSASYVRGESLREAVGKLWLFSQGQKSAPKHQCDKKLWLNIFYIFASETQASLYPKQGSQFYLQMPFLFSKILSKKKYLHLIFAFLAF